MKKSEIPSEHITAEEILFAFELPWIKQADLKRYEPFAYSGDPVFVAESDKLYELNRAISAENKTLEEKQRSALEALQAKQAEELRVFLEQAKKRRKNLADLLKLERHGLSRLARKKTITRRERAVELAQKALLEKKRSHEFLKVLQDEHVISTETDDYFSNVYDLLQDPPYINLGEEDFPNEIEQRLAQELLLETKLTHEDIVRLLNNRIEAVHENGVKETRERFRWALSIVVNRAGYDYRHLTYDERQDSSKIRRVEATQDHIAHTIVFGELQEPLSIRPIVPGVINRNDFVVIPGILVHIRKEVAQTIRKEALKELGLTEESLMPYKS